MKGKAVKYDKGNNIFGIGIIEDKVIGKNNNNSNLIATKYLISDKDGKIKIIQYDLIVEIIPMEIYLKHINQ